MGHLSSSVILVFLALATAMSFVGEGLSCPYCPAKLPSENALQWHVDQSGPCRVVRAMKAAEEAVAGGEAVVVEFDNLELPPPEGPFYDDTAELIIEDDEVPPETEEPEDPLGDDGGADGPGGSPREFDSALETALWMNSAGHGGTKLPNRARNEWLKLMKDERYRLEECLEQWKSSRDMDLTIMKAAVGNVRTFVLVRLLRP